MRGGLLRVCRRPVAYYYYVTSYSQYYYEEWNNNNRAVDLRVEDARRTAP